MQTDLVIVSEYCQKCHIDPSFIILLEEGGLIDINITDGESISSLPSSVIWNNTHVCITTCLST